MQFEDSHFTCISAVILASKTQNQNIEGAHAGTHMHLYEDRRKEKNNQVLIFKNMHITPKQMKGLWKAWINKRKEVTTTYAFNKQIIDL